MVGLVTTAREAVFDALLARWVTYCSADFNTITRRWRSTWDQALAENDGARLPDLPMLVQHDEIEVDTWTNRGIGASSNWNINLLIYAKIPDGDTPGVPDSDTPGSSVLNPLLDSLDAALLPDDRDGLQTLGGLVLDCRIEGTIIKALGDAEPSGLCGIIVPVRILLL